MLPEQNQSTLKTPASEPSPLVRWASSLLLAASFFGLAAMVAFGTLGRQSPVGWAFIAPGLVCLTGWFLGRRQEERLAPDAYARQRVLQGTNAVATTVLVLVLLVGANYIAARRHKVFDLTSNQINVLAPQTQNALGLLPGRLQMTYVFAGGSSRVPQNGNVSSLLNAYKNASDRVQVNYVNAAIDLLQLRSLNLSSFNGQPLLLLQLQNGTATRQEVSVVDEQNITSALLKLINPKPRTLYFMTGHGELDPTQNASTPLNRARIALEAQNYTLKPLSLQRKDAAIPTDAAAVIAIAPQVDLAPAEVATLQKYMSSNGRLVLFLESMRSATPRWAKLLQPFGLTMQNGVVVDPEQYGGDAESVVGTVSDANAHPILRGVNASVVLRGALPLRPVSQPSQGWKLTPLFASSNSSGSANTGNEALPILRRGNVPAARRGPFLLAGAYAKGDGVSGPRAVIAADATFMADPFINNFGNNSFLLATINWTAGQDALVSIPPKATVSNTLAMPDAARRFAQLFSLLGLPVAMLLLGAFVWWKRR
jgi:ABC-type uncharacterized transport system involved in gliding motility auxiliary subunit